MTEVSTVLIHFTYIQGNDSQYSRFLRSVLVQFPEIGHCLTFFSDLWFMRDLVDGFFVARR